MQNFKQVYQNRDLGLVHVRFASGHEVFVQLSHFLFIAVLAFIFFARGDSPSDIVVIITSLSLSGVLFWGAYDQLRRSTIMLWSSLVWFRVATAVFFGLGNLVPYLGNYNTRRFIRDFYDFDNNEAMQLILLTAISSLIVITIARFFAMRLPMRSQLSLEKLSGRQGFRTALVFLILGGGVRYFIVLPEYFGWSDSEIPRALKSLSIAYPAGLFLLFLWSLKRSRQYIVIPAILILIDFFMGLIAFDKSEMAFTLLFAYMALMFHRFSVKRGLLGFLGLMFLIYAAQAPVHYGRYNVDAYYGGAASVGERIVILSNYFSSDNTAGRWGGDELNPFLRLSYVAPAAFVINEYNSGRPGTAHANTLAALIPRVLWPGKPVIADTGSQVYRLARGYDGASVGVGHFAEAYWSFGWFGPLLVFIPGGIILGVISYMSIKMAVRERWVFLPLILYGLALGYKVSGSWVPTIIGGFATFFVLFAFFSVVEIILVNLGRRRFSSH